MDLRLPHRYSVVVIVVWAVASLAAASAQTADESLAEVTEACKDQVPDLARWLADATEFPELLTDFAVDRGEIDGTPFVATDPLPTQPVLGDKALLEGFGTGDGARVLNLSKIAADGGLTSLWVEGSSCRELQGELAAEGGDRVLRTAADATGFEVRLVSRVVPLIAPSCTQSGGSCNASTRCCNGQCQNQICP